MSVRGFAQQNLDPALAEAVEAGPAQQRIIEAIARLEDPGQIPPHFVVVCRFNRICTGRFLPAHAYEIRRHPNVISLKAAQPVGLHNEGGDFSDIAEIEAPINPAPRFTGRGCIVAALDFGLDFAHPAFLNRDGTTRLVAFWHQGAPYDPAKPNRYGYGREYSPEEINAALRTADPYQALGYHPAVSDTGRGSHGTHTLDIAAGNGRYGGGARLVFVNLSTPRLGAVGDLGTSVRLLEALHYVETTARGCPWVVNLSVGRTAGSHDGTSLVEQGMHELLRLGPGRAIVQSAGNYRSADLGAHGVLRDGEHRDLRWIIDSRDVTGNEVDAWYAGKDRFVVVLRAPDGTDCATVRLGEVGDVRHEGKLVGRIYHRRSDPNNGDNHVEAFLYANAPSGVWTLRLIGAYVISGRFHAWIERDLARSGAQSRFDASITSKSYTLGTIATSPLVITVGAYNANVKGRPLAPFSSCGPTRDERHDKPELLAPGVDVVAARSIPRGAAGQEGLLVARSGTSMAAPHVTGAVAALYEAARRPLSIDEIRDCLRRSAETVERSRCCAWGRLDAAAAIREVIQGAATSRNENSLTHFHDAESFLEGEGASEVPPDEGSLMNSDTTESFYAEEPDSEARMDETSLVYLDSTDSFLDRAEQALRSSSEGRRRSETSFLQQLVRELGGSVTEPGLSPVALFREALRDGRFRGMAQDLLRVVGTPSRLPAEPLRAGDWMVRAVPGTGDVGHVAVLASGDLHPPSALDSEGIAAESTQPGFYGTVIEGGAFPHSREAPFARRLLDSGGRVPPHTLFLRPELPGSAFQAREDEDLPAEGGGPTPAQSVVVRKVPLAFFRLKFDEFVTNRKQVLVTMRIHNNKVRVTFAKDLTDAHGLKPFEKDLGHLEAELPRLPNPNITIKDLNSNRVTADAIIVDERSTSKGKTIALTLDVEFETKGTELELNNFGDVDLQQLRIHIELALIRAVSKGRGVIGFRPSVRVDVKATLNLGPDGMARRKVKSKIESKLMEVLRTPRVHEEFSRALTRWLVGGEWEVRSLDLVGTELHIAYVEPPRNEFVQVFPEKPQKPLTAGNLKKVDHIVVVMMENRSFDHMLGYLKLIGGRSDVDGLTGKEVNTFKGQTFRPFHLTGTVFPHDPCHGRDCTQQQVRNDTMQGFVANFAAKLKSGKTNPGEIMGYYDAKDLPVYDALAREFVVCDRWFSAHPGPTFPNRFYTMTGRLGLNQFGEPVFQNPDIVTHAPSQTKTIFDHLSDRNVTWRFYEHGFCSLRLFHRWAVDAEHIRPGKEFFSDAASGKLPAVSFIDPAFIEQGPANDDHAPADVRDGQRLIGRIVNALMSGPAWSRTLLLVTYDEHGGFYDHVVPPRAINVSGEDRYGVRVPTFVVSPLVERGRVSHTEYDHTSILKTIVRRFCSAKPPDLGKRVEAAEDVGPLLTRARPRTVPAIKLPAASANAPKEAIDEEALLTDPTSLRSFHGLLAATRARYARAPVAGKKTQRPVETVDPDAFDTEEDDDEIDRPCRGKIGNDDRRPVRQAWDIPHRWICQISARRRKGGQLRQFGPIGTGVLISPRFVLTAAHLLRGSKKNDQGQWVDTLAEYVVVTPARDDAGGANSEPFGKYEAKAWHICPKYNPHAVDSWKYDYALIELKNPAGAKRAQVLNNQRLYFWGSREGSGNTHLEVLPANQVAGRTAFTAGYPGDLGGGTKPYVTSGTLSGVDLPNRREIMTYDADGCPGQSGSPIWIERDAKRYLVGIFTKVATGYDANTGNVTSNQAVRITQEVFHQISRWLETVLETPWLDAQENVPYQSADEGPESTEDDVAKTPTRKIAVGERVVFDLTKTYGADLDQVRWTIPGRVVGDYRGTVNDAKLVELAPGDLERPKISFFWVDPGQNLTVRAEIKRKSGAKEAFVAAFDVEAPTASLSAIPGVTRIEKLHGTLAMQFGKPLDAPGVLWRWKITMPARHAGFIKDVQTVRTDRSKVQRRTTAGSATRALRWEHPSNRKAHVQLDGDSDNQPIYTPGLADEAIEAGKSRDAGRGTSDSPTTNLASLDTTVTVNDKFSYYLMFKPKTPRPEDAIWVPIAKATWIWKATADHGDKWTLRKAAKMEPVVELTKVDFPLYESNASDNEWRETSSPPGDAFDESEDAVAETEEGDESDAACTQCR